MVLSGIHTSRGMTEKPLVGAGKSVSEADLRLPTKACELARIQQFARRPIGL